MSEYLNEFSNSMRPSPKPKKFWLILFLVLLGAIIGLILSVYSQVNFPISKDDHQKKVFQIEQGESLNQIADDLKQSKLISSTFAFKLYARQKGLSSKMKAGEFLLSPDMNTRQILLELTGDSKDSQVVVRIIEGSTLTDMADYLDKNGIVTKSDFLRAVQAKAQTFDYYGETPEVRSLEGYLFPDTYYFKKGVTSDQIIDRMLEINGKRLTPQIRADIKSQGKSIYDILTLASIVEKEVGRNGSAQVSAKTLDEERANVSGIFYNRLNIGMPLQSDATVTYITKKKDPSASIEDTHIDSPYNTYKYKGLPPGPISSPSLSAIQAVVYPKQNDYFYFLTKPDGTAVYAVTFEEHVQNKAKYLK